MTLYGVRARSTPEESNEREMRREMRLVFPEIFNPGMFNNSRALSFFVLLRLCTRNIQATKMGLRHFYVLVQRC